VAALRTCAAPSRRIDTVAWQGAWPGVNVTPAIPYPTSQFPSRIDPIAGVRLAQPNRSAPAR
jgi:hypothetical protein